MPSGSPTTPLAEPSPRSTHWIVAILFFLSVSLYANSLINGFVYDDKIQILANPYVKSWHYLPQIFTTNVWSFVGAAGDSNYYRPLMTFTFLLLWKVFGGLPFGFHLSNILLNALVAISVFYAARLLFRNQFAAAAAALLFAVHPIHTETVDWIAAVPDLEATLLVLTAFRLYASRAVITWPRHLAIAGCYILAMMAKEPALMLAPLLVFYEHFVRSTRFETPFSFKLRQYLPTCLAGAGYFVLRSALFGKFVLVLQHPQITFAQTIYSAFALVARYALLLIWPSKLSAFHVFHESTSPLDPLVLTGIAVVTACLMFLAFFHKKYPAACFALIWIGLYLGPVLNARWMAANVLTERYLYLPSAGFCWLFGVVASAFWSRASAIMPGFRLLRAATVSVSAVLVVLASAKIVTRNTVWRDDVTLYSTTLITDPDAYVMHLNLGTTYIEQEDYRAAEQHLLRAQVLKPDSVNVLNALAYVYIQQNRFKEAEELLTRAIALKPTWTDPHFNYGKLLEKKGKPADALAEFRAAVRTGPYNATAHFELAEGLAAAGNDAEAESEYRKSLEISPSLIASHGLSRLLIRQGRVQDASLLLENLCKDFPYDVPCHLELGKLLEAQNQRQQAAQEYRAALASDPQNKEALTALQRLSNP